MSKRIGFISTRFSGTDGVTLEASKWAEVFESYGHRCYWFGGELDRKARFSYLVPEAHFKHDTNMQISKQVFGVKRRNHDITKSIHRWRSLLSVHLHKFIDKFNIDLIVAENVLSIPMHVPLGLALTETIAETHIPTICHHHDFYWERVRYAINAIGDYLRMAFPPNLPNIKHVVINSEAQEQLALRTGISSVIIPNVLDFENPPNLNANRTRVFRESIGLAPSDVLILQPTRVVQRKGIEYAIELVKELADPRYKLVVSHEAGDEGFEYLEWLKDYALEHGVDLRLVTTKIDDPWENDGKHPSRYSLWDVYPHADFITYPSLYEGFGNAFLEAIYFKKPLLINRYSIFVRDIEPLGFDLAVMDGYLSKKTVQHVRDILESTEQRRQMVDYNYEVAAQNYSYTVLRKHLSSLMREFFGESIGERTAAPTESKPNGYLNTHPEQVLYKRFNGRKKS